MEYTYTTTVPPTSAVVSIDQIREWLRVVDGLEDIDLARLVSAATDYVEDKARVCLAPRTVAVTMHHFPASGWIIPVSPVIELTSLAYKDEAGQTQIVDSGDYFLFPDEFQPSIYLRNDKDWPSDKIAEAGSVTLTLRAGYDTAIPEQALTAIRFMASHWYEHRVPVDVVQTYTVPHAFDSIIQSIKRYRL